MQTTLENIQYIAIKNILRLLSLVPRHLLTGLAPLIGNLWYRLDRKHRTIAMENMQMALAGHLPAFKFAAAVRSNFVQLVRVMLELPSLLRVSADNLESYVRFEGQHHLTEALARGKGVLALTAHLGNWELNSLAISLRITPIVAVMRPLDYGPLNRVVTEIRSRTGNIMLDKVKSAEAIGPLLRRNHVIGILLDQNASWYDGVYVPYFGKTACTSKGLAMFALRYDAAVVPIFNVREADGRYRVIIEAPVRLKRTRHIGQDILENTAMFNRIIERNVRLAPDNWLWVHRRWRIKPVPERAKRKIRILPV